MAGYETSVKQQSKIQCGRYTLHLGGKTLLIGILNATPDSFSDGGMYYSEPNAVKRCLELARDGSDIVDIGGESTRPGSKAVDAEEEIRRTVPVIREAAPGLSAPISIDTHRAAVARAALEAGASMINDISSLRDPGMAAVAAEYAVPIVLMHMQGTPETMQAHPHYDDVVDDIKSFFSERIEFAVKHGIREDRIIIDPGIGFGKNLQHNLEIFRRLDEFLEFGRPVLVGPSRKSFIGMVTGASVKDRLMGTAASAVTSILKGARILRVHDVKEIRDAADIADAILYGEAPDRDNNA